MVDFCQKQWIFRKHKIKWLHIYLSIHFSWLSHSFSRNYVNRWMKIGIKYKSYEIFSFLMKLPNQIGLFYLLYDFKLDELELLSEVLLLSEPILWLSRRLGGKSKWYVVSVDSENGGRARIPYVVGRSSGFFANIILSKLNYKKITIHF